jgi:hypothetical protein
VENVFDATIENSVAGVIASLAADDDVSLRGKNVDNLTFAFVAPLRSN